jgi:hypothetical protein
MRTLGASVRTKVRASEQLDFTVLNGEFGERVKQNGIVVFRRS